ncbi:hypothetical protein [Frondihabitans australicus]|uniref:Uncharacterized protein n=1 Tax=Frondihabitans australicus TaxID=386892 RepID=A0A495IDA6_9MICO|nr:hypothetical protein [Frondihabitans australicus]RKR73942.1 hypothetical protein C8E83_1042 [Frondihabitans australicus]
MSHAETPYEGPQSQDVVFENIGPGPVFGSTSEHPVDYLVVQDDRQVLGFLWFTDDGRAASFAPRRSVGGLALNAGVAWREALLHEGATGALPSQAIEALARGRGLGVFGRIRPGSQGHASSSAELKAMAATE